MNDNSNIPIVSEEVKDILIKGMAFPELIEAWLKYGVLTEQELN